MAGREVLKGHSVQKLSTELAMLLGDRLCAFVLPPESTGCQKDAFSHASKILGEAFTHCCPTSRSPI